MSKQQGKKKVKIQEEPKEIMISERIVQYVDDPKNSSALAKIHEISNKAKRQSGKSPTQIRRNLLFRQEKLDPNDKNATNIKRRKGHFATVKPNRIDLQEKLKSRIKNNMDEDDDSEKKNEINEKNEPEKKSEIKMDAHPRRKYKKENEKEVKDGKEKEEKGEIIEKLKQYKKAQGKRKKRISVTLPQPDDKYAEVVYEKRIIKEGENDDSDDEENKKDKKNTKYYKRVVKEEPNSKVVITKKVIEETTEEKDGDKLVFDKDDSSGDEDVRKELKKLRINPSRHSAGNVKVRIITEEYDEKGNKIYSKEIVTNKIPKGLKENGEIVEEFENFEGEFNK